AARDGGPLACDGVASCENPDSGPDSGEPDAGGLDSGGPDSGGQPDAGDPDSGAPLACGALTRCGDACFDLSSSSAHCGSCGHSCYGAACTDAECQPELVVTVSGGLAMAVSVDHLFFTSVSSGVVKRSGKVPGSTASVLFDVAADSSTSAIAKPIVADASHVFVGTTQAGVRRAPVGGTASTALNGNWSDTMLAMNATDLAYVFNDLAAGKKKVVRIKKDGSGIYNLLHEASFGIGAISVGSDVFWANA